jgi:hypothetical protein
MRTRAYRPEFPACLEERSLLSGVAGPSADPVVFTRRRFNFIAEHMRGGFQLFVRNGDVAQLHNEINEVAVWIPFVRADGLQASINRIVDRMQRDISANVPYAIRTASNDVIAVTRADLQARAHSGDVVVR